ncbi:AraC family transcriptional regulator [Oryzomicrobium sp.]|uniref:AraC family transcriptional regulator n=1 Tax=Oryzomicrobium sp. TaxID=1911578 RepID=UPI0025FCFB55|nr:AraC family transcriptional regulator [Oryzomicrobium sp.]MCE1244848.1 AraC family transcriptional regulator [Oryzomicrobium sp.]
MSSRQDRLIHWLLGSLDLDTTLFHLGQYCGTWKASITGLSRAGFHVVLNGRCWLHLPETGERRPLQAGDAVFFLRDVPHVLSPEADPARAADAPRAAMAPLDRSVPGSVALACGFFEFRTRLTDLLLGSFPDYVVIPDGDGELAEARPLFDLILAEAERAGDAPSPLVARLVELLFFYVVRHLCRRREVSAGLWALLAQPGFAPLLDALIAAPEREWTVEAMADLTHMSRATFFKRFQHVCGTSPSQFLLQLRMKVASQLIRQGTSLSRAAEQVGYQSDAAFSRAFKKATGVLPGAYRRRCQPEAATPQAA